MTSTISHTSLSDYAVTKALLASLWDELEQAKARTDLKLSKLKADYEATKSACLQEIMEIKSKYQEAKLHYNKIVTDLALHKAENKSVKLTKAEKAEKDQREALAGRRLTTMAGKYKLAWNEALQLLPFNNKQFATWTEDEWYEAEKWLADMTAED